MLPYCQRLNLSEKPLKDGVPLEKFRGSLRNYNVTIVEKDDINPNLLSIIDELGLTFKRMTVFYKDRTYVDMTPHLDFLDIKDFVRLNWVYKGRNSKMRWFKIINEAETEMMRSLIDAPYYKLNPKNVELAYEDTIPSATIVQSCIPHDIVIGNEERFAFSLIMKEKNDPPDSLLTMSQALKAFKDYIPL